MKLFSLPDSFANYLKFNIFYFNIGDSFLFKMH
jgi:hypothetical protein